MDGHLETAKIQDVEKIKQKEEISKLKQKNKTLRDENNYLLGVIKSKGPRSLINKSANCYLNSSFQALAASTQFYEDIRTLVDNPRYPIAFLIYNLIQLLNTSDEDSRSSLSRTKASDISTNKIFKKWNKSGQQDCHELISYIINEFYKEVKHTKNLTHNESLKLPMPMRIMFQSTLNCKNCQHQIDCPKQVDMAIHVNLPKYAFFDNIIPYTTCELNNILDATLNNETINGFCCPNCQSDENMIKLNKLLAPLPQTLCLHLQRSSSMTPRNIFGLQKLRTKVMFNEVISIKFFVPIVDLDGTESFMEERKRFKLVSIIEHSGLINKGHYRCFRMWREQWYSTNDTEVVRYEWEDVAKRQPYILIYDQMC